MSAPTVIVLNDFGHIQGGASQVAIQSARALAKSGCRVIFFCAVEPIAPELADPASGVRVVCTRQPEIIKHPSRMQAAFQGLWNSRTSAALDELLREFSPRDTIIHLHGWTKALSSSVIRLAVKRGFPVVCTMHDYFLCCPNGGFFNFQRNAICKLAPLSGRCIAEHCDARSYPQKLWRVARQAVQSGWGKLPGGVTHFISVSRFSQKLLEPHLPAGASFTFVQNPVDARKQPAAPVADNSSFVAVGRLNREKGGLLLAEAAAQAKVSVLFVGEGPERAEIEKLLGPQSVTGWLERSAVHERMRGARALILPSLLYETQGLVVQEAAAVGVPAIVADTSAACDLVENGVTGLWFKGGDREDLQRALQRMQDRDLAAKLGAAAYEKFWNAAPTPERHASELREVYEKVLSQQCREARPSPVAH
ncbi:MAG TPA: glycosyltransferase family 4 protein [Planctomycetota bacterium]|nr:glycosyltransferase family 4 protein [Planctomycetota bacterium]